MANDTDISNAARTAACAAILALIDAGAGPGTVEVRSGTKPAGPATAPSDGALLATLTCSDPAFGAPSNGVATANAITSDSSADNTGTASWFRVKDSNGTAIIDGTVGTSSADMIFSTVSFVAGAAISLTSWTFTVPASQ
jgi:hypothetical protein